MKPSSVRLPNLLIAGYHKAGTTTLFHELSNHPDIFPSLVKEPFYFRPFINGKDLPPIEEYAKHFIGAKNERYLMEGSPTYIYGGERAAKKIKETLGDIRIIISLRNPVDQLFSLYKHHLRFMEINKDETFLDFIKAKEDFSRQYYDLHLEGWFNVFGDNIKCVFFKPLIQTPEIIIPEIIEWLGLTPLEFDADALHNVNPGGMYKNKIVHQISLSIFKKMKKHIPHNLFIRIRKLYYAANGVVNTQTVDSEAIAYLKPILAPHNARLATQLSKRGYEDLPSWLTE